MSVIGKWRKPSDRMPVIGEAVIADYPDGRQVVLHAYLEGGSWHWLHTDGSQASEPAFWLDEYHAN